MRQGSRSSAAQIRMVGTMASLLLLAIGRMAGCGAASDPPPTPRPAQVVVSIPPLQGLVEALLPAGAEVRVLVAPGQSPHTYEPTPSDVAAVGRADLVVLVGMGIEAGLPSSARDGPRVLSMAAALGIDPGDVDTGEQEHEHHNDHDHDHVHGHSGLDPHVWLDPVLVESFVPELAAAVRTALDRAGADAAAIEGVSDRADALLESVRAVDRAYRERLGNDGGAVVITQHPAWSRLFDRYGIVIASEIQLAESGPSAGHLAELVQTAKARGVRAVLSEPQLDGAIAERLAAQLGVPLGMLDPLGSGDWAGMMRRNLDVLTEVLGEENPEKPDA